MGNLGMMGVDWEARVDFAQLRESRVARAKEQLDKTDLGALVLFRTENIRYVTSAWLGSWTVDKLPYRYCVLVKGQDPILYTSGLEVAWHYRRNAMPWLGDRVRMQVSWVRGGLGPVATADRAKEWASGLKKVLQEAGVDRLKVGFDILDMPMVNALNEAGIEFADGQACMVEAQVIKTDDEVELLRQACTMATAAFWHIRDALRPGIRESELKAIGAQTLYSLGSEGIVDLTCASGPNTNPNFGKHSDRIVDWGDLVFLDIMHQHMGYQTCYYRAFVCGGKPTQKQRDLFDECRKTLYDGINVMKPGITTADVAKVWPTAESLGVSEIETAGKYLAHGIGLSHHGMPFIYPGVSGKYPPIELRENMCFAVETYAGDLGGDEGVRLEEDVVVTKTGVEVLTKFPLFPYD